jgi:metal iron transporter
MNCPSRTEEPEGTGYNQNPSSLAADLTTRQDLNGIANTRVLRRIAIGDIGSVVEHLPDDDATAVKAEKALSDSHVGPGISNFEVVDSNENEDRRRAEGGGENSRISTKWFQRLRKILLTFGKFVGPGFMGSSPPIFEMNVSNFRCRFR